MLQAEIAAELQISRPLYSYYEGNKVRPTLETIFDLSELLRYPFLSLLQERAGDEFVLYDKSNFSMDRHWAEKVLLSSVAMMPDKEPGKLFLDFQAMYIDKSQCGKAE